MHRKLKARGGVTHPEDGPVCLESLENIRQLI